MIDDPSRFQAALERFDAANQEDPHVEVFDGKAFPKEFLYAQRMTSWLERLEPDASEPLQLAARAQHLCRWMIPREQYPLGRRGYLRWRTALYRFHAEKAGTILSDVGYDTETIRRVQQLLHKEGLHKDPEAQTLEDVACLVFLEHHLADFSQKHDEEKLLNILRKTWKKMSSRGHQAALNLALPDSARELVEKALIDADGRKKNEAPDSRE